MPYPCRGSERSDYTRGRPDSRKALGRSFRDPGYSLQRRRRDRFLLRVGAGLQAFLWTESEVTDKLFRILEHSFAQVIRRAKEHKISHRTAAMAIGVERLKRAFSAGLYGFRSPGAMPQARMRSALSARRDPLASNSLDALR